MKLFCQDDQEKRELPLAIPKTKTCRICLLARENTPSPNLGFIKKESDQTWYDQLKLRVERAKVLVLEILGHEIIESPEDRKLIAPCECKGTMKYVHRGCLNVWRLNSTRRDSYYKCEQCFTKYHFKETPFSILLSSPLITKLITGLVFFAWIYGWFLFVGLTHSLTGQIDESSLFVDYSDIRAMGYHRGYYAQDAYKTRPTSMDDVSTSTWSSTTITTASSEVREDIFSTSETNDKTPHELFVAMIIPASVHNFFVMYLFELAYTVIIVALFDFLITNPSVILAVNMIYLIWRCIKYGGSFELAWLSACVSFGLARTLRSIHMTITGLIQRYVKLRCIEIVNQDDDPIITVKHERLKAETQLY